MNKEKIMGVSEWAEYGKKYGYWDYFKKEILKEGDFPSDEAIETLGEMIKDGLNKEPKL